MNKFLKYYPFWLGILYCLMLIGHSSKDGLWSFSVLAYPLDRIK